jgi:NADH:ubiquinone oxidoreductase subunit 6 (chain J)
MVITIVVLALTALAAAWTVMARGLLHSALGLAVTSIFITILMFMLGANLAAVFELSVCAGLITVVFVSTISMTQPATKSELLAKTQAHLRRYWFLPVLMVAAGAAVAFVAQRASISLPPPTQAQDVKEVLWHSRQTDILGQIIILFAGVLGVIVLFKERRR